MYRIESPVKQEKMGCVLRVEHSVRPCSRNYACAKTPNRAAIDLRAFPLALRLVKT
jgi:hypothetical protein